MEILLNVQRIMEIEELGKWIIVNIISSIVFSYINVWMFVELFKIETKNHEKLKFVSIDSISRFIVMIFIPAPYYRIPNIIIKIILFKILFKKNIEKCILGGTINAITIICTEILFSKMTCAMFEDINTYSEGMLDYRYKLCIMLSISICRVIICFWIKMKNISINITDNLSSKNRINISVISIISLILIFFNTFELTMYIKEFPYSVFILDIFSLLVCFYISMKQILKIAVLEDKEKTINNLEAYNKTLSIMYDNIRAFRHDFSNFVQALDGYVKTNNIEGIRKMNKDILKECTDVNNMGILDPKIINNAAIYSIITNKYYLAEKYNITMNIEVMIDLNDIKISNYNFCRILSILLDNAIEAARECDEKVINVRFIKDKRVNRKLLIVENTYTKVDIDTEKIFEKGYTTKENAGNSHGLGLWTVRRILNHTPNLNLFTKIEKLFYQQLEIYEN